jgi:glycine/D-amino acid oxidase-like deaminating enzyme
MREEVGSDQYHGGLVDERSAGLNPAAFVAGLTAAARRAGATILEETAVERVTSGEDGGRKRYTIESARGTTAAADVVIATGAYTGAFAPWLRRRVIPLGSFVIATEKLDEAVCRSLLPRGRMVFDSNHFLHYYRITPDRRMLFGGRAAFFPETDRTIRDSAEILRRGMVDVFPQLREAAVDYAWGGTLDFTYDRLPHAGRVDGMHYAIGYAGHGVAMATYLGEKIGGAILGDLVDDPLFEIPLPSAPLHADFATPWLLPLAGMWFKFLDWAS